MLSHCYYVEIDEKPWFFLFRFLKIWFLCRALSFTCEDMVMIVRCSRLSLRIILLLLLGCYYLSILIFLSSYQSQHWHKHVSQFKLKCCRKCLEVTPQVFGSQCSRIEILRLIVLKRLGFRQHCCQLQIFKGNTGTSQPSLAMFYYFTDYGPLGEVVCASLKQTFQNQLWMSAQTSNW